MIPIVTPEEMGAIDRGRARAGRGADRAGRAAVARAALDMLGGAYGRRVVVVAGKGNNGNDGRDAARRLRRRGVRGAGARRRPTGPSRSPPCDLVIDAAYGTGFRGGYRAPAVADGPAGAGRRHPERRRRADRAVPTGGASGAARPTAPSRSPRSSPGCCCSPGPASWRRGRGRRHRSRRVVRAAVGSSRRPTCAEWLPERDPSTHKWQAAVWVVAGSPGMDGAAALVAAGAPAGRCRLRAPVDPGRRPDGPARAGRGRARRAAARPDGPTRCSSGLDRVRRRRRRQRPRVGDETKAQVRRLVAGAVGRIEPEPIVAPPVTADVVVDADGITALGRDPGDLVGPNVILTPHDGEFRRLARAGPRCRPPGRGPRPGRAARVRRAAQGRADGRRRPGRDGARGRPPATPGWPPPAPVTCWPGSSAGWPRRASTPLRAAAAGAFLHGRAGDLGWRHGLVAGDLPALLPAVLDRLDAASTTSGPPDT